MAGVGNVYKSEACFLSGIDPWRPVGSLSQEEAATLGSVAARLLAEGVRDGGPIRTWRPPDAPPGARERTWVYGRPGRPCRRCGARDPVARAGRRQPDHLLVPRLPALTGRQAGGGDPSRAWARISMTCSLTSAPISSETQVRKRKIR